MNKNSETNNGVEQKDKFIINDPRDEKQKKIVEIISKIITTEQEFIEMQLKIRNYLNDLLDEKVKESWKNYSEQKTTENMNHTISLENQLKENQKALQELLNLKKIIETDREEFFKLITDSGFDKADIEQKSKDYFDTQLDITKEREFNEGIQKLKSFQTYYAQKVVLLDSEIDIGEFNTSVEAFDAVCRGMEFTISDSNSEMQVFDEAIICAIMPQHPKSN